jgi:hypothetical protein
VDGEHFPPSGNNSQVEWESVPNRTGAPAVAARFATPTAARVVIEALENGGIDGNNIELLEPAAALAPAQTRKTDVHIAKHLARVIAEGVLVGIAAGACVAVIASVVLVLGTGLGFGEAFFACVLICVLFGATMGGFVAFERAGTLSDAWPRTFEDRSALPVWLGVYAREARVRGRARQILEASHPLELVVNE